MFNKKSDEQEWSRFRGALSKDREDVAPTDTDEPASATQTMTQTPTSPAAPTSPRLQPGDVNVTVPSRASRGLSGMDSYDVESLIGERTTFEGTLKSEGALRILGTAQGQIESKGAVIVEEKAHVSASIRAGQVTIAGTVDGQIYSDGKVEIRPTGHVTGEITAGALIVQEGAYFEGNSRMANAPTQGTAASGQPARATDTAPKP